MVNDQGQVLVSAKPAFDLRTVKAGTYFLKANSSASNPAGVFHASDMPKPIAADAVNDRAEMEEDNGNPYTPRISVTVSSDNRSGKTLIRVAVAVCDGSVRLIEQQITDKSIQDEPEANK